MKILKIKIPLIFHVMHYVLQLNDRYQLVQYLVHVPDVQ